MGKEVYRKTSVVTHYELEYGARRSGRYADLIGVIEAFLDNLDVLSFEVAAARRSARVRAELEAGGTIIGSYDLLIAGHALSLEATLVTNNVQEFGRVEGLRVENWATG